LVNVPYTVMYQSTLGGEVLRLSVWVAVVEVSTAVGDGGQPSVVGGDGTVVVAVGDIDVATLVGGTTLVATRAALGCPAVHPAAKMAQTTITANDLTLGYTVGLDSLRGGLANQPLRHDR
jgi:hypothetical protein